jgi:hypothetical protein
MREHKHGLIIFVSSALGRFVAMRAATMDYSG